MQNASRSSMTTDFHVIASQLANEKLEIIIADKAMKAAQYDYIVSANYPNESLSNGSLAGFYTRTVGVTEVAIGDLTTPQANSGVKKVDVNVSWSDTDGTGTQQVSVSTLLSDFYTPPYTP